MPGSTGAPKAPAAPAAPRPESDAAGSPATEGGVRVEGAATDLDGKPLRDVRLRFMRGGAKNEDPRALRSDAAGRFVLEGMTPGTWKVEAEGAGYLPIRLDVPFKADTGLKVVMVRQSATHVPQPLDLLPVEKAIPPPAAAAVNGAPPPTAPPAP